MNPSAKRRILPSLPTIMSPKHLTALTAFFCCAVASPIMGAGSPYLLLEKAQVYDQTTGNTGALDPLTPFVFSSRSSESLSFTPPGGLSVSATFNQDSSQYEFTQIFGTQAALDTAFPNGTYTLSAGTSSNLSVNLTGDLYPETPAVTNATWNASGQLTVDPTQSVTLNFNPFLGYGKTGVLSHMEFKIGSYTNAPTTVDQPAITPTNPSAFTSYTIPPGTLAAGSIYACTLQYDTASGMSSADAAGNMPVAAYSKVTMFTLTTSGTAPNIPTITKQPTSQTAALGSNATFSVTYINGGVPGIQWFKNGLPINGVPSSSSNTRLLVLNNIQASDAGSYFAAIITTSGGYVQSDTVTLSIGTSAGSPPVFTAQPHTQTISDGSTMVFYAAASGSPAPTYQWFFNGGVLSSGGGVSHVMGPTLVINGATAANAGDYYCVASNASGSVRSASATLAISGTTDIGRLINISCRAAVGTGPNILIAGFAVGGQGTVGSESLLVRGSGPALVPFGVTGTLPDPELQLFLGTSQLGTNSGWGGAAQISATASAVGAFSWSNPSSHDAALLESLPAGPYTAQILGQTGDTGVALAEVYDATPPGTYTPTTPRLVNISARVQVGTGGNILIAGFVIGGSTSRTVLIRASGPALAPFGVTGTLADPELLLYSGSNLLGTNTGWGGSTVIAQVAASVGAFSWSDPSSTDSAILATLPPGSYTAQVKGASGDTGIALVEVYEVE